MLRPRRAAAWPALLLALFVTACDREPETLKGPVAIYQGPPPPKHGMLGVRFDPAAAGSTAVSDVVPGSPARKAGISPGDVITSVDGRPVSSQQDVLKVTGDKPPGATVTVGLTREGEAVTVSVRLISFADAIALQQQADAGRSSP